MSKDTEPNFADLIGKVTPIKKNTTAPEFGSKPKRKPLRKQRMRDRIHYRALEPLCHNFDRISALLFHQMRTDRAHCSEHIDLHGQQVIPAINYLRDLLDQRRNRRLVCWRIVHGKGSRSPHYDRAPLKHATLELLLNHPAIAAIAAVTDSDGASGAVIIAVHPATG